MWILRRRQTQRFFGVRCHPCFTCSVEHTLRIRVFYTVCCESQPCSIARVPLKNVSQCFRDLWAGESLFPPTYKCDLLTALVVIFSITFSKCFGSSCQLRRKPSGVKGQPTQ